MKNKTVLIILAGLILISLAIIANAQLVTNCCEKTTSGAWCQNAPAEQCKSKPFLSSPTSCEATSYCREGCCYDSSEGVCMEHTSQRACENSNGTWEASPTCEIPQCDLGCCVLGTQASFVTLTRCKKLSAFYGLMTDFRSEITDELECISLASLSDQGACVYEVDYSKTCKFTSRQGCNSIESGQIVANTTGKLTGNVTFYKDLLCSADELGTNCGKTDKTTCVDGKDEVYFLDSCGNVANIYDASRINDPAYWRKKVYKDDSCSLTQGVNSCGNCDYFTGTICRQSKFGGTTPVAGNYVCTNLDCPSTTAGKKKNGESWCSTDAYPDSVGSQYFRHLCINGEEIIEPCADFRQEVCVNETINGFTQAACRVNRWKSCSTQTNKTDCEDTEQRDCTWTSSLNEVATNTTLACIPKYSPGLNFWADGEASGICSQANAQCDVTYVKKIGSKNECDKNCNCLAQAWTNTQSGKCSSIGDCGVKQNFVGTQGSNEGYKITTT